MNEITKFFSFSMTEVFSGIGQLLIGIAAIVGVCSIPTLKITAELKAKIDDARQANYKLSEEIDNLNAKFKIASQSLSPEIRMQLENQDFQMKSKQFKDSWKN